MFGESGYMAKSVYLTADEAAQLLGVRIETLYAYVSRGALRSEQGPDKRQKRYLREDVERLQMRKEQRRNPQKVTDEALNWGAPLLESELTLIEQGTFYYRGREVAGLARDASIEKVAQLLWQTDGTSALAWCDSFVVSEQVVMVAQQLKARALIDVFQVLLPLVASADWRAYDTQPQGVVETGERILGLMVWCACRGKITGGDTATALQRAWVPKNKAARTLFNAALVLCADHELNASSFTARCAASAGATPYEVVGAGLATLRGTLHGGICEQVEAFWHEAAGEKDMRTAMVARLRRGEQVPGFGHRLYPQGDPRWRVLIDCVADYAPTAPSVVMARQLESAGRDVLGLAPNVDMGLAAVVQTLKLPAGSALALFALGRAVGWIAHAIEQYSSGQLIRPRARYVGPRPEPRPSG
jgi:citrate synthase